MKRVITLQEPWASLVAEGIKTIETRSWPCYQYGSIFIHASKALIPQTDERRTELSTLLSGSLHYGEIIAECELSNCILIDDSYAKRIEKENPLCFRCGDFTPGRYAWVLSNIRPIKPIPIRGKQGIWYSELDI